jgi:predicted lipoprotein with Yx(FWY)xxD motif
MKSQKPVLYALMVALLVATSVIGLSAASAQTQPMAPTIKLSSTDQLGSFLVDANGMTLYIYTKDTPGVSNCTDQCAQNWPPLLVQQGETPTLDAGIPGQLGVITRADGGMQVVFNGMPLYTFAKDQNPGDTTGQGVGNVWYVAAPATVSLGGNSDLGQFLVGANGMTLYMYTKDTMDVSNCYDQCATNWPPLLVKEGETPTLQPGLDGKLDVIDRTDGTKQVAFDGMPLYYWAKDQKPGDSTGQNVGSVWFVIQPKTVRVGGNDALGKFLVGPNGMTLYTYAKDAQNTSNCTDQCAVNWPPLLVAQGQTPSAGDGVMGTLGVITRADGTMQVTDNGMPLYYFIKDVVPGDANGQNVGNVWTVATP